MHPDPTVEIDEAGWTVETANVTVVEVVDTGTEVIEVAVETTVVVYTPPAE